MSITHCGEIKLIGLPLPGKTYNRDGQSAIDCGNLWQKFESEQYHAKIPHKMGDDIYAVYHQYEGDHTQPFSYFIGCKVEPDAEVPEELDEVTTARGTYQKFTAKGKMPDCVADAWKDIWEKNIDRAYTTDFEIYDERSKNWNDAEVDIFIALDAT